MGPSAVWGGFTAVLEGLGLSKMYVSDAAGSEHGALYTSGKAHPERSRLHAAL